MPPLLHLMYPLIKFSLSDNMRQYENFHHFFPLDKGVDAAWFDRDIRWICVTENLRRQVHYTIPILFSEQLLTSLENCRCHTHFFTITSSNRNKIATQHIFNTIVGLVNALKRRTNSYLIRIDKSIDTVGLNQNI